MPDRPTVLLSDANVLIDYRDSDLSILTLVVQYVAPIHVVRNVIDEVDDLSLARCREMGMTVIEVDPEVLLQSATLSRRLSRYDHLSLHMCHENDWICVTNDRPLRRICGEHDVRVKWGLELMLDLVSVEVLLLHTLSKRHGTSVPTTLITSPRKYSSDFRRVSAAGTRRSLKGDRAPPSVAPLRG